MYRAAKNLYKITAKIIEISFYVTGLCAIIALGKYDVFAEIARLLIILYTAFYAGHIVVQLVKVVTWPFEKKRQDREHRRKVLFSYLKGRIKEVGKGYVIVEIHNLPPRGATFLTSQGYKVWLRNGAEYWQIYW